MKTIANFKISTNKGSSLTSSEFTIIKTKEGQKDFKLAITGTKGYRYNLMSYRQEGSLIVDKGKLPIYIEILGPLSEVKEKIAEWTKVIRKDGIRSSRPRIYQELTRYLEFETIGKKLYLFMNYETKKKEFPDPYQSFLSLLYAYKVPKDIPEEQVLILVRRTTVTS